MLDVLKNEQISSRVWTQSPESRIVLARVLLSPKTRRGWPKRGTPNPTRGCFVYTNPFQRLGRRPGDEIKVAIISSEWNGFSWIVCVADPEGLLFFSLPFAMGSVAGWVVGRFGRLASALFGFAGT